MTEMLEKKGCEDRDKMGFSGEPKQEPGGAALLVCPIEETSSLCYRPVYGETDVESRKKVRTNKFLDNEWR